MNKGARQLNWDLLRPILVGVAAALLVAALIWGVREFLIGTGVIALGAGLQWASSRREDAVEEIETAEVEIANTKDEIDAAIPELKDKKDKIESDVAGMTDQEKLDAAGRYLG